MDERVAAALRQYDDIRAEEVRSRAQGKQRERNQSMFAVSPEAGQLLNILASSLKEPQILELGTSFGYSTIWLAEAARTSGGHVTTFELEKHKSAFAEEMATKAGLDGFVDFRLGDAVSLIATLPKKFDFVLVDLWKDLYVPSLEAFYPKLKDGAIVVADNMIRPGTEELVRYGQAIRSKSGISSVLLPVGTGFEVSVYHEHWLPRSQ